MSDIPNRLLSTNSNDSDSHNGSDKPGQWMRRRRIDGALNRVPENFYQYVWRVLEKVGTGYFVSTVLLLIFTKMGYFLLCITGL